jgi:putative ATP-binding cassette transporter
MRKKFRRRREHQLMFAGLIALLCGANGLYVVNSYVGRNFMTSIADRLDFARHASGASSPRRLQSP